MAGKESACQCRIHGFDPWVRKIPWRRKWQPTPVFLPGKSHGQRSLVGYDPWGCNELDTTEQLNHSSDKSAPSTPQMYVWRSSGYNSIHQQHLGLQAVTETVSHHFQYALHIFFPPRRYRHCSSSGLWGCSGFCLSKWVTVSCLGRPPPPHQV